MQKKTRIVIDGNRLTLEDFEDIVFNGTPVALASEAVQRKAEEFGVAIAGSEVVGLIPQAALKLPKAAALRIPDRHPRVHGTGVQPDEASFLFFGNLNCSVFGQGKSGGNLGCLDDAYWHGAGGMIAKPHSNLERPGRPPF
jgi:hypothetical protein